ncbi:MAG TPA: hypothetical protein VIG69_09420 [Candidatus Methylomirabilis sp.]|jgi:outer membrane protein OmpA-like peptidoglycan-associated protein
MEVIDNRANNPVNNEPLVIFGHLLEFGIGSAVLRRDHRDWLESVAAPFLKGNQQGSFVLVGFASRSGAANFNQQLSEQRVRAVLRFLTTPPRNVNPFQNAASGGVGERAGERAGQADGTEDSLLRAVLVELWSIDVRAA